MRTALKRSDVTLYRQLDALLREQIRDGILRPGGRMPSETELSGQYGVSRATVRQALEALEQDELIERHPGRGTFVRRGKRMPQRERKRQDWRALIDAAAGSGVFLRGGRAVPPPMVAKTLGLDAATEAAFAIRVIARAGRARLAVKTYTRPEGARWLDDRGRSFAALARRRGIKLARGEAWLDSILAEPRFAMMLKVRLGAPLLSIWWVDLVDKAPMALSQMLVAGGDVAVGLS